MMGLSCMKFVIWLKNSTKWDKLWVGVISFIERLNQRVHLTPTFLILLGHVLSMVKILGHALNNQLFSFNIEVV